MLGGEMRPSNILVFMTDQQRGSTLTGPVRAVTPNLDRFRSQGVTFSQAFCPSPHCCPSRATFMSGLYPSRHGVWNNVDTTNALSRGLADGVHLWSEDLRHVGYNLFYHGKWHVSNLETPADRGWEDYGLHHINNGGLGRHWKEYRDIAASMPAEEDAAPRRDGQIPRPGWPDFSLYGEHDAPFGDREVVEFATERMGDEREQNRPWCRFIGPVGPHDPYLAPRRFLDLYDFDKITLPASFSDAMADKPGFYRRTRAIFDHLSPEEHRRGLWHYLAFCSYEDHLFGMALEALERSGQAENTVVVYLSDHGDYTADHGLWCKGLPCFRGAYHIPCVIRWPRGIRNPGRQVDEFVSLADFAPTFLDLAGVAHDNQFNGASLLPFLRNEQPAAWRDALFTQSNGNELYGIQRSVTTKEWKYVFNGFDFDELYDLRADPDETVNVAARAENRPVIKEMCRRLWRFSHENGDRAVNPYIMVGFAPYGPAYAFR